MLLSWVVIAFANCVAIWVIRSSRASTTSRSISTTTALTSEVIQLAGRIAQQCALTATIIISDRACADLVSESRAPGLTQGKSADVGTPAGQQVSGFFVQCRGTRYATYPRQESLHRAAIDDQLPPQYASEGCPTVASSHLQHGTETARWPLLPRRRNCHESDDAYRSCCGNHNRWFIRLRISPSASAI